MAVGSAHSRHPLSATRAEHPGTSLVAGCLAPCCSTRCCSPASSTGRCRSASCAPDRREAGARRGDRAAEAGDPGRLQRSLFASLRGHRADPARCPASTAASRSASVSTTCSRAGSACCIRAISSICRWRRRSTCGLARPPQRGPDAAIMFASRLANACRIAAGTLAGRAVRVRPARGADGPIEAALVAAHFHDPRAEAIGADQCLGRPCRPHRRTRLRPARRCWRRSAVPCLRGADPHRLRQRADRRFTRWAGAHDVRVIGGLPTGFADAPMPDAGCGIRIGVYCQWRRLPRAAEFQPLSARGFLRYRRTPERDLADRALAAARRAARTLAARATAMASRAHCSSSSCRSSRSSGTT